MAEGLTGSAASIPYEGTDCTAEEAVEAVKAARKTVSDIFREHGYPPMDDERRARVEATRLAGLATDD